MSARRLRPIAHAEDHRDHHHHRGRDQRHGQRDHRVVPQPGAGDDRLADDRGDHRAPAAEHVRDGQQHQGHQPTRATSASRSWSGLIIHVGDVVLEPDREACRRCRRTRSVKSLMQLGQPGPSDVLQERPVSRVGELGEVELLAREVDEDDDRDQQQPPEQPAAGRGEPRAAGCPCRRPRWPSAAAARGRRPSIITPGPLTEADVGAARSRTARWPRWWCGRA